MTPPLPGRWPVWMSFLALAPLALAAGSHLPVWALPVGATGAAAFLLVAARGHSWAQRAAALDAAVLVAVGTAAGYATAVGSPPPLDVPLTLAWVLLLGTPVIGWAAQGAGSTSGVGGVPRWVQSLRWDRALAFAVLILGIGLGKCLWAFEDAPLYAWLTASYSYLPLFALCLLCLPTGRVGQATTALAVVGLLAGAVWDFASTEVVLVLAEPLTWPDLLARFEDPASFAILAEGLRSWRAVFLAVGVFGGFAAVARLLRGPSPASNAWALARMVALVAVAGAVLVEGQAVIAPRLAERYIAAASAPWSSVHVRPSYERRLNLDAARAVGSAVDPPIWAEGPVPVLAGLAGRYPGRSVILVVLESHRASNVAGLGEGALGFDPSSPHLSALAAEGLWFTGYVQSHRPTHSALWELLTGLPYLGSELKPVYSGPEAAQVGAMPRFEALGYQCDWICPHSTKFDNWDRFMQAAGARFWINPPEMEGFDRAYWTSWGMPDPQLLEVARRRFESVTDAGRPLFLGVLTISNHNPYKFPDEIDGVPLTPDLRGGMRYADHALGQLVDGLRRFPAERRPIVFVTADTSTSEGLREADPMGIANLEGLRIPGLLLLPDGALAGESYDGLFAHEDLLDLLYLLVAPDASSPKFVERHRAVVSSTGMLLTPTTYFDTQGERFFEITSRWSLNPTEDPPDRERLLAAQDFYDRVRRALWSDDDER